MINVVILLGNLGKDPRAITNDSGVTIGANFTLATNRAYTNRQGEKVQITNWHDVVIWNRGENKTADFVVNNLKEGSRVSIQGTLTSRSYKNKDGETVYVKGEVSADRVVPLDGRRTDDDSEMDGSMGMNDASSNNDDDSLPF